MVDKMTLEERVESLEKEIAELKRQLDERQRKQRLDERQKNIRNPGRLELPVAAAEDLGEKMAPRNIGLK